MFDWDADAERCAKEAEERWAALSVEDRTMALYKIVTEMIATSQRNESLGYFLYERLGLEADSKIVAKHAGLEDVLETLEDNGYGIN